MINSTIEWSLKKKINYEISQGPKQIQSKKNSKSDRDCPEKSENTSSRDYIQKNQKTLNKFWFFEILTI